MSTFDPLDAPMTPASTPPPQHGLCRMSTFDPLDAPIGQPEWAPWAGATVEAPSSGGGGAAASEARTEEAPTTPSATCSFPWDDASPPGAAASAGRGPELAELPELVETFVHVAGAPEVPEGAQRLTTAPGRLDPLPLGGAEQEQQPGGAPPPQHGLCRMSTFDPLDAPIEQHEWAAAWPGLPREPDGAAMCYQQHAFDSFECEPAAPPTDMPPCDTSAAPAAEPPHAEASAPALPKEPADALRESPAVLVMLPVAFGTVMLSGEHPAAVPSQTPPQLPGPEGHPWQPQLSRQPQTLVQVQDPYSGVHRVSWVVDARKLRSTGSQVVSKAFELPLRSGCTATFAMMLRPKLRQEGKGRYSFHASKGHGFVQLKCETELSSGCGHTLAFRVGAGADAAGNEEPLRGPVVNDFAQHSVCGLPEAVEEWNFASGVDPETQTFVVVLEVLPQ